VDDSGFAASSYNKDKENNKLSKKTEASAFCDVMLRCWLGRP
jgi:hypothetical protein